MTERSPYRPRKPITFGSFLIVALVTLALFVPAFSAHVAVWNASNIDASATDYVVGDDGEDLTVTIRVHNPTRSAFTAKYGTLFGEIDGEHVTKLGVEVEKTTIPAGETKSVTVNMTVKEDYREDAADAIESGRLTVSGHLKGTIQNAEVEVGVSKSDD